MRGILIRVLIMTFEGQSFKMLQSCCMFSQSNIENLCAEVVSFYLSVPDSPPLGFSAEGRNTPQSLHLQWSEPKGSHNGLILFYVIQYCVVEEEECIGGNFVGLV